MTGGFGLARFGGPEWAITASIGAAFLIAISLMFLALRARWRGR